jgi:type III secretion system FlhB-like substrate exporter
MTTTKTTMTKKTTAASSSSLSSSSAFAFALHIIKFCRQNLVKIFKVDQIIRLLLKLITLVSIPDSTHMMVDVLKIPLFKPVVPMAVMQKMAWLL